VLIRKDAKSSDDDDDGDDGVNSVKRPVRVRSGIRPTSGGLACMCWCWLCWPTVAAPMPCTGTEFGSASEGARISTPMFMCCGDMAFKTTGA
jgi:hypothetical protein